jgi:hypothetical protein
MVELDTAREPSLSKKAELRNDQLVELPNLVSMVRRGKDDSADKPLLGPNAFRVVWGANCLRPEAIRRTC